MPGQLFTQYFLTDGIRATPERRAQAPAFAQFRDAARPLFHDFANYHNPNETQTEQDLIRPLLELLGWTDDLPQQTSSGGKEIPDLLLFADARMAAYTPTRVVEDPRNRDTIQAITQFIVDRFQPEQVILLGSSARRRGREQRPGLAGGPTAQRRTRQRRLCHSPRHRRAFRAGGRPPNPFIRRDRPLSPGPQLHDQPAGGRLGSAPCPTRGLSRIAWPRPNKPSKWPPVHFRTPPANTTSTNTNHATLPTPHSETTSNLILRN